MNKNAQLRQRILEVLYQTREANATPLERDGWITEAEVINAVGTCAFALSVLTELNLVNRSGYLLKISGAGVLACEEGWVLPNPRPTINQ